MPGPSKSGGSSEQHRQNDSGRTNKPPGQPGGGSNPDIRQGVEMVGDRLREGYDSARDGVRRGYKSAERVVSHNPAPSLLVSFGVGFGLGLVACLAFAAREKDTWAERHLPDSLLHAPDSLRHLVEQARHLPDLLKQHVPASISRHLG